MRAFDALSVPNLAQYQFLRDIGFEVASGYIRALTRQAVATALGLGMGILPLTEQGTPTSWDYFTAAQGRADGERFVAWAEDFGMPHGVPFVGTFLDFDADAPYQAEEPVPGSKMEQVLLPYINEQFNAIARRNPMWMYGPRDAIEYAAKFWPGVAGFMQAYAPAWSQGRNDIPSGIADIIQFKNGLMVAGIPLDMSIVQTPARLWRLG